jgi:hypothetical protein
VLHEGTLENFEAGFSQAELFLEAIHLEEELKKKAPALVQKSEDLPAAAPVSQLSNKEKNRFAELPGEIDKLELRLTTLRSEIASIDFAFLDKEKKDKLTRLESDLKKYEGKLEGLFEEWATLEAKGQ